MNKQFDIREANPDDLKDIQTLLPRLAEFEIPAGRQAEELWRGDNEMFVQWAQGQRDDLNVLIANNEAAEIIGVAAVSMRKEMLSGAPSSHLEVLAIDKSVEGQGLGRHLINLAEEQAKARGAESMTLHVFAANQRARQLYEKTGFHGEVIRYKKALS